MNRGNTSGYSLTKGDASIVMGMISRGDRHHDIAAWFGVNQGRIAEVLEGKYESVAVAPESQLPPKGAPGVKGKHLRTLVGIALDELDSGKIDGEELISELRDAIDRYDLDEA